MYSSLRMYTRPPVEIHRLYYFLCWWPIWFSESWKCVKITWFCSLEPGKDVASGINGSLSNNFLFICFAEAWRSSDFLIFVVQSNLAIRNFLVALKLFLNAKSSLSLWNKWQIGHRKWFLIANLFLIKPFLIAKFDCSSTFIADYRLCFLRKLTHLWNRNIADTKYLVANYSKSFNTIIGWCLVQFSFIYAYQSEVFSSIGICYLEVYVS